LPEAVHQGRTVALLVGFALLLLALAAADLREHGSEVGPLVALARDATTVYAPGTPTWPGALFAQHAPGDAAVKRLIVALNGETDSRALAWLAVLGQIGALVILLRALRCVIPAAGVVAAAAALLAAFAWTPLRAAAPLITFDASSLALMLSAAHVTGALSKRRGFALAGYGCGFAALACADIGAAGFFAVAAASLRQGSEALSARRSGPVVAALAVAAAVLVARFIHAPIASGIWRHDIAGLAAWPFVPGPAALLVWAPVLLTVGTAARSRLHVPPVLLALAAWAAGLVLILPLTNAAPAMPATLLLAGLVVNGVCAFSLLRGLPDGDAEPGLSRQRRSSRQREIGIALVSAWFVLVGVEVIERPPAEAAPDAAILAAQTSALAEAVRRGDPASLATLPGTDAERAAAHTIATSPALRPLLPVSIRAPLPVFAAGSPAAAAFQPAAAPPLKESDSLRCVGTWRGDSAPPAAGEFVSAPVRTAFPMLQLRVGGVLQPPDSSIVLRTDTATVQPLQTSTTALDRWKRINFPAPAGEFRIVAHASARHWLAITEPVEIGTVSRFLAKVPPGLSMFLAGVGGIVFVAAAAGSLRRRPASEVGQASIPWKLAPWIALFAYAVFFAHHLDPTAGPNDSGGYLNSAKLMTGGHLTATPRTISGAPEAEVTPYLPITFHANGGAMVPEYPVGWPLEVAAFGRVFGLEAGLRILMVLQLVLGPIVTQRLGRAFGLSSGWSWFAAGVVALSPVYLFEALQPVSDGPALLWVSLAVYWAWLGRERWRFAVLAGLATALAVMIRPANLLCVMPVFVCLAGRWRQLVAWALAGLPGAVWLAWYQQVLYGSWHTTGYGDIATSFELRFVPLTLRSYAIWLPELLTPVVVLGFGLPWLRGVSGRIRLVLLTWIAVFLALYSMWWCTWDNWFNMRFVLPAFPAMVIAGLLVARTLLTRLGLLAATPEPAAIEGPRTGEASWTPRERRTVAALAVCAAVAFGWLGLRTDQRRVTYWMWSNHKPGDAATWCREHLAQDAVLFAKHLTGSLFYYTDFTFVRLDYEPAQRSTALFDRIRAAGRPIYALTCHWETRNYDWSTGRNGSGYPDLPGRWERVAVLAESDILVWKLADAVDPR
jgi:hypothetical protein